MARMLDTTPGLRRSFERSNRSESWPHRAAEQESSANKRNRYARLIRVVIQHDYYNTANGQCPDFDFAPTNTTAELLRSLGLVFRAEANGFSIYYPSSPAQRNGLLDYLRRDAQLDGCATPPTWQVWTRMSVALRLRNPYFVNFTAIPIGTDPDQENFYLSNRSAHRTPEGDVLLTPGKRVAASDLLPTVSLQTAIPVGPETREIRVRDVSHDCVLCLPRCIPRDRMGRNHQPLPANPTAIRCADIPADACREPFDANCVCMPTIYVDFALLPEGRYSLVEVPYADPPKRCDETGEVVLHTAASPLPFAFIDLFFTDPSGASSDLFPVRNPFAKECADPAAEDCIRTVEYRIVFGARRTFWRYYVLAYHARHLPDDLTIKCHEPHHEIEFDGPYEVRLPSASGGWTPAQCFVSTTPLSLMEHSHFHFSLRGSQPGDAEPHVLVERLPVPSIQQVTPDHRGPASTRPRGADGTWDALERGRVHSDLYVYV